MTSVYLDDTIVAIATPSGRGGIGVVRLSGADASNIARPMLRLAHGHDLEAGRAHFGELIEPATGERLDEVVVIFFAKPHSYTTDDVVEISCHGSPVVLRHVAQMALAGGARLAEPGEFTMRAFLNGRIDLTQAEAVRDLIESQTLYQAQVAARQLEGGLSKRLQPTKQKLIELVAALEAGVDFAEDDVSVMPDEQILARIAAIRTALDEAESIGVRKSIEALADADIALVVLDVSEFAGSDFTPDRDLLVKTQDRLRIVVCNKSDLLPADRNRIISNLQLDEQTPPVVFTSALTGEGIEQLRSMILEKVRGDAGAEQEIGLLTNVRKQKLEEAATAAFTGRAAAAPLKTPTRCCCWIFTA